MTDYFNSVDDFRKTEQIGSVFYLLINKHLEDLIKGRADVILDIGEFGGKLSIENGIDNFRKN